MKVAIVALGVAFAGVGLLSIHSSAERNSFIAGCVRSGMPQGACELDWTDRLWMTPRPKD